MNPTPCVHEREREETPLGLRDWTLRWSAGHPEGSSDLVEPEEQSRLNVSDIVCGLDDLAGEWGWHLKGGR